MNELQEISNNLKTQDNRITSLPIFVVQQKRRIYGIDTDYSDECVWLTNDGECQEVDQETADKLTITWLNGGNDAGNRLFVSDYTRTAYIDIWEFCTCCFTEAGAEAYIAANGHNLKEHRIYVESGYRNIEFETIRNHLLNYKE